jgi:peroxiredoxin
MNPGTIRSSNRAMSRTVQRIALGLAGIALAASATAYAQEVGVGARAPELGLPDLNGSNVTIASLRGRVVVVDFMASWCEPCADSMPVYQRLYSSLSGRGLTVVAVSQDRSVENARQFAQRHHLTFPVLFDGAHAVANRYHPSRMPTAFVIDRGGIVRHVHQGYNAGHAAEIEREVRALLDAR